MSLAQRNAHFLVARHIWVFFSFYLLNFWGGYLFISDFWKFSHSRSGEQKKAPLLVLSVEDRLFGDICNLKEIKERNDEAVMWCEWRRCISNAPRGRWATERDESPSLVWDQTRQLNLILIEGLFRLKSKMSGTQLKNHIFSINNELILEFSHKTMNFYRWN